MVPIRTVAAASAGQVYARPSSLRRIRRWNVSEAVTATHFITTPDGWELALSRYGTDDTVDRSRPPVLLVHGLASSRLAFDTDPRNSFAGWLAEQGYDTYSIDLRGHGFSEQPTSRDKGWRFGLNDYALVDVPTAIDAVRELTGATQVDYVGHSMGGIILYMLAALGGQAIRRGITLGSSLNYAGLPTYYTQIAPLRPLLRATPAVPIDLAPRISSRLSRFGPRFVDPMLVVAENVDLHVYRKMTATCMHRTSGRVLRDLACVINGTGFTTPSGEHYERLLFERGYEFPILAVAGSRDIQCLPATVGRFGTHHRSFGRPFGHREDYGHHDLIMGRHVREETWPVFEQWFRGADVGTGTRPVLSD
jgi:pimeloyl-ACP methyl ester carboxylesterase